MRNRLILCMVLMAVDAAFVSYNWDFLSGKADAAARAQRLDAYCVLEHHIETFCRG